MSIKLTLDERHNISKYAHGLTCTIKLRRVIDDFFNKLEITPEEFKKYDVKIDPKTLEFSCNDDNYTVEYESFPEEVTESMKKYITAYDHESSQNNEMLQTSFKYFRKLL